MTEKNAQRAHRSIAIVDDPLYWQALGKFIEKYASTEAVIFNTLASCCGISIKTAQSIFSGTRTIQAMEFLRRINEANNITDEKQRELEEYVFPQLANITALRNHLLHYGSFVTSDAGRISSDISRAHTPKKIREMRTSVEILEHAIRDIEKINSHLISHLVLVNAPFDQRARIFPNLLAAWQYKHQLSPPKKAHKSLQKDQSKKTERGAPRKASQK